MDDLRTEAGRRSARARVIASGDLQTEGSRRMSELPGSLRELASQVGCSPQTVANWRTGTKVPDELFRARIHAAWGIPPAAWGVSPHTELEAAPPAPAREPSAGPLPSTLLACVELLELLRKERNRKGMLPGERVKLADTEARILALRHRLEKEQELLEDRIVREHPTWMRLRRIMVRALAKHPEAARAVAEALSEFDSPAVQ